MRLTLARKFDAVHRNTVASNSMIPIVCLQRDRGFLPSLHTLTALAGDPIGLLRSLSYRSLYAESSLARKGVVSGESVAASIAFFMLFSSKVGAAQKSKCT